MEGLEEPENYPEALSNAAYAFKDANEIPDEVQTVLDLCDNPPSADIFWTYIQALKQFISVKSRTPVSGLIPDFHSDTVSYVKIKQLYNQSAERDFKALLEIASKLTDKKIDEEDFKNFCRNWQFSECIQMRPIQDEIVTDWQYEEDPEGFGWYFVFKAADTFHLREGRWPRPSDKDALQQIADNEVKIAGMDPAEYKVASKFVEEMYGFLIVGVELKIRS